MRARFAARKVCTLEEARIEPAQLARGVQSACTMSIDLLGEETGSSACSRSWSAGCPDCPGARLGRFEALIGADKPSCAFETVKVPARAFVPPGWAERHAFGLVRRGVLIRQRAEGGSTVAVDAAGPGCVVPLEAGASADYAATDLLVCLMPRAVFERALADAAVGRDLIDMQASTLSRVERLAAARGAASVRERVVQLLCALADTLSPPRRRERLPAGLQQRDLARLVGVRHETFCRVLGELEREGAIERDPDGLRLLDRAVLEGT